MTSLTWYTFARFGGVRMNGAVEPGGRRWGCDQEGGVVGETTNRTVFCRHLGEGDGGVLGLWYSVHLLTCALLLLLAARCLHLPLPAHPPLQGPPARVRVLHSQRYSNIRLFVLP